ncbi:nucleotidyltransferase domain-containing protein [Candidatus Woesearchaeota archaeon]|jgi:predicted nucleotidyltransferase|nr:nucleotidyltransferase domain-containing protein [Candidatus Woesearchaeota archaeon]MBT5739978.1 nucleotidyltransferase domain-containing protein [Candidatus Woesearchaeota archaeon]
MLKELKKCLKNELKENDIFDIVVYGSMVKGKARPGDIDILVIFTQGTLKERLSKLQVIKKKIKFDNVDVKAVLWNELFDPAFFAKTGIFLEGVSLKNLKKFSLKIGFSAFSLFTYNLKDKLHREKVKFNYVLSGRGSEGIVKKLAGEHLGPGVIKIPIGFSLEFEDVLTMHKINFKKNNILVED